MHEFGLYREALYDRRTDPGEMVNLAVRSSYRGAVLRHRAVLADWMEKTDDAIRTRPSHPGVPLPLIPGQAYPRNTNSYIEGTKGT